MTPGSKRFVALDSLRGVCALLVCCFHFRHNIVILQSPFFENCWQFVDFFFVLSGFVIAANYRSRIQEGMPKLRFISLRFGRVYPMHVFMLGVLVAAEIVASYASPSLGLRQTFDASHDPAAIITNLLMVQSLGIHTTLTWNAPAWSIATEFWAYVMFAIIVGNAKGNAEPWFVIVAVGCLITLALVTPNGMNVTYDWGMARCASGFAVGVLSWSVWRLCPPLLQSYRFWTFIETLTICLIVGFVISVGPTRWNELSPFVFALSILVFSHEGGLVSRVLMLRLPVFIGTVSYSIYMIHYFVQARLINLFDQIDNRFGSDLTRVAVSGGRRFTVIGSTPMQGAWLLIALLILIVLSSWMTFLLIERPGQRWSRALFDPKTRHR